MFFSVCILMSFLYAFRCLFFVYLMITIIFVSILVFLLPIFFPGYYVSELLISFLPYIVGISLIFLGITFFHFKKKMKPWYRFPTHRYFWGISFLSFCFLFFWYSKQLNNFYVQPTVIQKFTTKTWNMLSWDITILFANIHKDNAQYDKIEKTISDSNPDVLMFVEFADHHYLHLKDFLQEKYPYTNNTTRSKKFVGSMVFSKYPLSNKADDFPQWMWRYGYFSLPYQGQKIYFYLVHTSSPDNYSHFIMRNEQLTTFVKDYENHESNRKHPNIIAVWDFNVTPWSSYYDILSTAFSGELVDFTKYIPFLFTRQFKQLPFLQAHIDHAWISSSLEMQRFSTITIPWSDHKAFLFTISLKK